MRGIGCCITVAVGALAFVPGADAVTFGANLNRPADSPYTCGDVLAGSTCSTASSSSPAPEMTKAKGKVKKAAHSKLGDSLRR